MDEKQEGFKNSQHQTDGFSDSEKKKKDKRKGVVFAVASSIILALILFYFSYYYVKIIIQENKQNTNYNSSETNPNNLPEVSSTEMKKTGPILKMPILMYHYILDPATMGDKTVRNLSVSPENLKNQISYFIKEGYEIIDLDYLYNMLKKKEQGNTKKIILTFDDGYDNFYTNAFPILKTQSIKATVFLIVNKIGTPGYLTWNQIKEMDDSGLITFGSHTLNHAYLSKTSSAKAYKEIYESKSIIEEHLNHNIDYFCYPYGSFDKNILKMVEQAEYKAALSTVQGVNQSFNDRYWLERIRIGQSYTGQSIEKKIEDYEKKN